MIYKYDDEIIGLVKAFEERTLPKSDWTHAAHLTVGLYYCFHNPFGVAKNLMSDGIYWLNDAHGTANTETSGYHETLTVFWLKTIAAYLEKRKTEKSLMVLANGLLASVDDTKLPLEILQPRTAFFDRSASEIRRAGFGKVSVGDERFYFCFGKFILIGKNFYTFLHRYPNGWRFFILRRL